MKVKVEYTITLSDEDMHALTAHHHGERLSQSDIRQMLTDLGKMGLEDQLFAGGETIKARTPAEAEAAGRTEYERVTRNPKEGQ